MDDKTKKDLVEIIEKTLDKKFEEKFIRMFNLGFEQVMVPALQSLENELKLEIKGVRKEIEKVGPRIDSHDRRTDHLATQVGDYEKRIKKLESKRVVTV